MQTLYRCLIEEERNAVISKLNAAGMYVSSVFVPGNDKHTSVWIVSGSENSGDASKICSAGRLAELFDANRTDEYSKIPITDIVDAVEIRNYHMSSE